MKSYDPKNVVIGLIAIHIAVSLAMAVTARYAPMEATNQIIVWSISLFVCVILMFLVYNNLKTKIISKQ